MSFDDFLFTPELCEFYATEIDLHQKKWQIQSNFALQICLQSAWFRLCQTAESRMEACYSELILDSDFAHFFEDGAKLIISSEIKIPLIILTPLT